MGLIKKNMKKIIYLLVLVLISNFSFSQIDTTIIKIKNRKIVVINEKIEKVDKNDSIDKKKTKKLNDHWSGIGFGTNNFINESGTFGMNEQPDYLKLYTQKSINVSLNLFDISLPVVGNQLFFVSGVGFEFNNYRFSENNRLVDGEDGLTYYEDTLAEFSKSKLTVSYLTVPLLVEFQFPKSTKKSDRIFVSAGVIAQLKIASHTKYVYYEANKKIKDKEREDYYLSPFLVYGIVMAGYKDFSLYAKYSPLELFEANKGPELYPVSAGVIFHF